MKKLIVWVLLTSIMAELSAQQNDFYNKASESFTRHFSIQLDKGEKMQLQVTHADDLQKLGNIDSIVRLYKDETAYITDTLSETRFARKINYIVNSNERKMIKVNSYPANIDYYILQGKDLAYFKYEQDTVIITGLVPGYETAVAGQQHYYRLTFHLNDLNTINVYANGQLKGKVQHLRDNMNTRWSSKNGTMYLKSDPRISAEAAYGKTGVKDLLILQLSVDAQNYKNAFVPSATIGFGIRRNNGKVIQDYFLASEMHFRFTSVDDKTKRYLNSFITFSYGRRTVAPAKEQNVILPFLSLGYLARSSDPYYEKNTFRLGVGRMAFGGNTIIEPAFYFNDLFKNVTPSLRIVQRF